MGSGSCLSRNMFDNTGMDGTPSNYGNMYQAFVFIDHDMVSKSSKPTNLKL